jgi:hypothetical protein
LSAPPTAVELLCVECGEVLPEAIRPGRARRTRFCSQRCSRRFHAREARKRKSEIDARIRELKAEAVQILRDQYYSIGEVLDVSIQVQYIGWGRNDHRPYGRYEWTAKL